MWRPVVLDATMQIHKDHSLLTALQAALAGHKESCLKKMNKSVVMHTARAFV